MRAVELKNIDQEFSHVALLTQVVKQPIGGHLSPNRRGTTAEDMRMDIRLLDKLEPAKDGDTVEFEDADWAHLCTKLKAFEWAQSDRRIRDLVDGVINTPQKA